MQATCKSFYCHSDAELSRQLSSDTSDRKYLLCDIHFIKCFFSSPKRFLNIHSRQRRMCWYVVAFFASAIRCCRALPAFVLFAKLYRRWRIVCVLCFAWAGVAFHSESGEITAETAIALGHPRFVDEVTSHYSARALLGFIYKTVE